MFELAFGLIVIVIVGNIYYFVKNVRAEKKAVDEKLQNMNERESVKTSSAKSSNNTNKKTTNKKKNYSYKK